MAKKSNKTEHVLKLITKSDDDVQDDLFQLPQELAEIGSAPAPSSRAKSDKNKIEIVSEENEADGTTSKYETKLKIDIEPEINIKQKKPQKSEKLEEAEAAELQEQPVKKPEPEQLSKLNEPDCGGSTMLEQHDHMINLAEILVREKIGLVMEKMKVCSCKTCVNDVFALTLNLLPSKYVTTDAGKQFVQLEAYKKQYETDILAALTKSCVRVKASPRHERMR